MDYRLFHPLEVVFICVIVCLRLGLWVCGFVVCECGFVDWLGVCVCVCVSVCVCVCVSAFACRCVFVYYVFGGCVSVLFGVLGYEYAFVDFCGFVGLHVLMYFTYELCNMI